MVCSVLCVHHLLSVSSVVSRSVEEGGGKLTTLCGGGELTTLCGGGELTTLCGDDTTSADVN